MEVIGDAGYHGEQAENGGYRGQKNGPQARAPGCDDRLTKMHPSLVQPVGVVDEHDGVVNYYSCKGDNANPGHDNTEGQPHDREPEEHPP